MERYVEIDINEFNNRVKRLKQKFPPEAIYILDKGTNLYHRSQNPKKILADQLFDPQYSHQYGAFSFATESEKKWRNMVIVTTAWPLVLFDRNIITYDSEFNKMVELSPETLCNLPMSQGFEGEISDSTTIYVEKGREVVIYPNGLSAVNNHIQRLKFKLW